MFGVAIFEAIEVKGCLMLSFEVTTSKISQSLIYYGRTMGRQYDRPAV